jgi:DNA-binding MarR family transcriptional regulator
MAKSDETINKNSVWIFKSNHAHVLICLSRGPECILRHVAEKVGITERAVQKIIKDLEEGGVLTRKREGRQNIYTIHNKSRLRHPLEANSTISDLIKAINH